MLRIGPGHYRPCKHYDTVDIWEWENQKHVFLICRTCGSWFYRPGKKKLNFRKTHYGQHTMDVIQDIQITMRLGDALSKR
jgi:hypothetical protein